MLGPDAPCLCRPSPLPRGAAEAVAPPARGYGRRRGPVTPLVFPLRRLGASPQGPAGATTLVSSADRIRALHVPARKVRSGGQIALGVAQGDAHRRPL